MKTFKGKFSESEHKFAIIQSRFNNFIGEKLLEGAVDCFKKHKYLAKNIDIVKVPGAFEIPVTADKLASSKKYNAIVCLGAVIKGVTPHFNYIADAVSKGCLEVSLKYGIPVIFGVLTTDTYEQALERSSLISENPQKDSSLNTNKEAGSGNKGWDAALAAIEMADLMARI